MAGIADGREPGVRVEVPDGRGVLVGDQGEQVNQFIRTYVEHQVVQAAPVPAAGPVVAGNVPQKPPAFRPRKDLGAALRRRGPGRPLVHAVTGMPGTGKTQVAAAYARARINQGWRLVAWVEAGDTAKVLNGLAEVAARLGIGRPGEDLTSIGADVRHQLERDGKRCLVVFDNVTDVAGLRPFLPAAGKAQVVITSTQQAASELGVPVPVGVFSEDDAVAFLAQRTGRSANGAACELARDVGYLPLALAQAAAVIAGQHLDYRTYLERLRALPVDEYLVRAEAEPYPRGVAEAVLLSLAAVTGGGSAGLPGTVMGLSGMVMGVVSMLSTAGAARALLHAAGQAGILAGHDGEGRTVAPQEIDQALSRLAGTSLLAFSVDGSSVSAHRLVMRVVREQLASDGRLAETGTKAAELLRAAIDAIPEIQQNRPAARDLVQQVIALYEHLALHLDVIDASMIRPLLQLRQWAVRCLIELGDNPAQAVEYAEPVLADVEQVLGEDHPDTLASRYYLARAYRSAGRLDEAIQLFERTATDREQVLGPTHPDTLKSRNHLAAAYHAAGRLDEAIRLLEHNVADREQVLGPTHPDTLKSRNSLAAAYRAAGRLDEAIRLLEHNVADREQVLGPTHPGTLTSRNSLAATYRAAGRLDEAIQLFERTVADREQVLGPIHPDTLTSRYHLARAYRSAGRLDEAIQLLERNVADREQVLRNSHPYTLESRNHLAATYQAAGRLDEAIQLFERTVADRERVLGEHHPDTLQSRNNLALAYQEAGRLDDAILLYERTLTDCEQVLGEHHPVTLAIRKNLASARCSASRWVSMSASR